MNPCSICLNDNYDAITWHKAENLDKTSHDSCITCLSETIYHAANNQIPCHLCRKELVVLYPANLRRKETYAFTTLKAAILALSYFSLKTVITPLCFISYFSFNKSEFNFDVIEWLHYIPERYLTYPQFSKNQILENKMSLVRSAMTFTNSSNYGEKIYRSIDKLLNLEVNVFSTSLVCVALLIYGIMLKKYVKKDALIGGLELGMQLGCYLLSNYYFSYTAKDLLGPDELTFNPQIIPTHQFLYRQKTFHNFGFFLLITLGTLFPLFIRDYTAYQEAQNQAPSKDDVIAYLTDGLKNRKIIVLESQ